jgi:hypothetical protein
MEALGLDEPPWASTVLKSMVFIMQIAWRSVEDRTSAGLDGSEKHGFYYADRIEARAHGSEMHCFYYAGRASMLQTHRFHDTKRIEAHRVYSEDSSPST